jgi:cell division protein FtsQ
MIGIALVVVIGIAAIMNKRKGNVKDIVVNIQHLQDGENYLIMDKDIKEILRRGFEENVAEMKVSRVDVQRAERILEQDPFIENAEVFIDADNKLNIKIVQREPICRIIDNNGLNYYMDKNGIKMPPSKYFSARVPIITGAVPPHVTDFLSRKKYGLKDVYYLVKQLQADEFYKTFIQQIVVDAGGEFTLIPVLGDQKIRIGTIDDLDDKLKRIRIFYDEAMPYEGWRKYATISVKYKGQIVCKKK